MACRLFGTKPLSEPMLKYCWLGPLRTKFSEFLIEIHIFLFNKMRLNMSGKRRPLCFGLNVLITWTVVIVASRVLNNVTKVITAINTVWHIRRSAICCWWELIMRFIGTVSCNFHNRDSNHLWHGTELCTQQWIWRCEIIFPYKKRMQNSKRNNKDSSGDRILSKGYLSNYCQIMCQYYVDAGIKNISTSISPD